MSIERIKLELTSNTRGTIAVSRTDFLSWENLTINLERGENHGIISNTTGELEFTNNAYNFILQEYEDNGIYSFLGCKIDLFNFSTYEYFTAFQGILNFDSIKFKENSEGLLVVTINLEEDLFIQKFRARKTDEFNMFDRKNAEGDDNVFIPTPTKVNIQGQNIPRIYDAVSYDAFTSGFTHIKYSEDQPLFFYVTPNFDNIIDQNMFEVFNYSLTLYETNPKNNSLFTLRAKEEFDAWSYEIVALGIKFDIDVIGNGDSIRDFKARERLVLEKASGEIIISSENIVENIYTDPRPDSISVSVDLVMIGDSTEKIDIDDKLYIILEIELRFIAGVFDGFTSMSKFNVTNSAGATIKIEGDSSAPNSSNIPMLDIERCFEHVVRKISSDNIDRFRSDALDSELFITNGKLLRGRTKDETELKISFDKLFDIANSLSPTGYEIYNESGLWVVRVAPASVFYRSVNMGITLRKIKDFAIEIWSEKVYSSVLLQYKAYKSDELGNASLDEFNSQRQYLITNTLNENQYSIDIPAIGAGYLIEQKRRELFIMKQSDDKNEGKAMDDDIFILDVLPDVRAVAKRVSEFTNHNDGTGVINARFSPARIMQNHSKFLAPSIQKTGAGIFFQTGESNYQFTSKIVGETVTVDESQDFNFDDPIYKAEIISFTAIVTEDDVQTIIDRGSTYEYIEFDYLGKTRSGWIKSFKFVPARNEAEFQIIARPDTTAQFLYSLDFSDARNSMYINLI